MPSGLKTWPRRPRYIVRAAVRSSRREASSLWYINCLGILSPSNLPHQRTKLLKPTPCPPSLVCGRFVELSKCSHRIYTATARLYERPFNDTHNMLGCIKVWPITWPFQHDILWVPSTICRPCQVITSQPTQLGHQAQPSTFWHSPY